jgi:predicted nucleotidyltransferase
MDLARPLTLITPTVDADVLSVLAGAKASFTGRQVHQVAGRHSERGVRNALHRLCAQGIVMRERVGSSDRYTLNRAHLAAPDIEALVHLRSELFRRISASFEAWEIKAEFAARFGSAARGDMKSDSDIDMLVVRNEHIDADDDRWREQLATLAQNVTAWTGNDARFLELSAKEVSAGLAAGKRVLSDISKEGITLYGPPNYLRNLKPASRRRG